MRSRLNRIKNWNELARLSNYSAGDLAKRCNTSLRQVERFFLETEGKLPHDWLSERRQKKALNLIRAGCIVKEVAGQLGYSQAANFSRDFKRFHGASPTEI